MWRNVVCKGWRNANLQHRDNGTAQPLLCLHILFSASATKEAARGLLLNIAKGVVRGHLNESTPLGLEQLCLLVLQKHPGRISERTSILLQNSYGTREFHKELRLAKVVPIFRKMGKENLGQIPANQLGISRREQNRLLTSQSISTQKRMC